MEFNDFLFEYFRLLRMDLRDEGAWYLLEELYEAWFTRWKAIYEAESVLYAGYRRSTPGSLVTNTVASREDHPQDVNMDNPADWVSRIATGEYFDQEHISQQERSASRERVCRFNEPLNFFQKHLGRHWPLHAATLGRTVENLITSKGENSG